METVTISQIEQTLRRLPSDKLVEVYDFIMFLSERLGSQVTLHEPRELYRIDTMLASEDVLKKDWDTPEEDAAWAHL